ncbi:hypothetical protein HYU95_04930 [Candidatus Daviesbacteria bacterium]|nr:hypothetical protein [Candidatus Daviesbacteria bacterium]
MKYKSSNRWPKRDVETFFDIWSKDMAYVLGYFAADGSMYKNKRRSCYIAFTSTDEELINLIKKIMSVSNAIENYKNPYKTWKRRYVLQIGSRKLFLKLIELGFTPRKSLTLKFPKELPNELLRHFVRGYFDGDGCASFVHYKRKDRKNLQKFLNIRIRCGCKKFIQTLRDKITAAIGIEKGRLYFHSDAYELVYSARNVVKLYRFMYPTINMPCLERKRMILKRGLSSYGLEV